ncbi:hypothetical protein J2Y74_004499 [Pseudomonas migulae]|uniref:Tc toxin subunit A-related protein n=1 Tax=Pseudomonas migulae TaxID=78543 RepID=UPI00209FEA90|nr:neuraminidase-like domain-containing protein [Pseudomonas migulae]MCP1520189.1 hypothetical protein [Pseudomonas migulae]
MEKSIIGVLDEYRSEALADFYRAKVAPAKPEIPELSSLEDLFQYLLLDTQVSSLVDSSRVAEAIAAMQVYIGAIYCGMESGHQRDFSKEELEAWHKRYCNISDWAGYSTLEYYPENYINPKMRLNKTASFKALEDDLAQASVSNTAVQKALYEHLKRFVETCNLDLISAYIDETEDGSEQFKNAVYYFLGRRREEPRGYYWRKATVELKQESKYLHPACWSEWLPIDLPLGPDVLAVRPVFFAGRLMVVYVEGIRDPDLRFENGTVAPGQWHLEMKLAQLAINGRWSLPISLGKKDFSVVPKDSARLLAVTFGGARKYVDDVLAVCFTTTDVPIESSKDAVWRADEEKPGWMFASLNSRFEPQDAQEESLEVLINGRFANPMALQHQLHINERSLVHQSLVPASVSTTDDSTQEGLISKYISTNISLKSRLDVVGGEEVITNVLQVQGVCEVDRPDYTLNQLVFAASAYVLSLMTYFELSKVGAKGVKLTCHHQGETGFDFSLHLENEGAETADVLVSITKTDFVRTAFGVQLIKDISLTHAQLERLWMISSSSVRSGAGFFIAHGVSSSAGEVFLANSVNKLEVQKKPETVPMELKIIDEGIVAADTWKGTVELNGWGQSVWIEHSWTGNPVNKSLDIVWGQSSDGEYGRNRYKLEVLQVPNSSPVPLISKQESGGQFLDLRPLGTELKWVQLNSTFGDELVAKAAISIDEVLSRSSQFTHEPAPWESPDKAPNPLTIPMDFNSAHGMFYWELFFHLPFLIAYRLAEERNYRESQNWYHYIFNPQLRVNRPGAMVNNERYWLCRPLLEPGDISFVAKDLVDPDAIAFAKRIHYRKAIFIAYVRCIIAHADSLYRHLTRDSLAAAKLQYIRALFLMGDAPKAKAMSHWVPTSVDLILSPLQAGTHCALENFSRTLDVQVANLPARISGLTDFSIIRKDVFRPIANEDVLGIWKYIDNCLGNMRNNLTIDGKQLSIPLFAEPTDPKKLLQAQAGGSSGASRSAGGWRNIPHYRFRVMLSTAQNAVQTLISFGREVRQCMEARDRSLLEEQLQKQQIELGAYATAIQQESLKQQEESLKSLQESKKVIDGRIDHYRQLLEQNVTAREVAALEDQMAARTDMSDASQAYVAEGFANHAPNMVIMGVAAGTGGIVLGGSFRAMGLLLGGAAEKELIAADRSATSSHYGRRSEEWGLALNQGEREMQVLDAQIEAQRHAVYAARSSLEHAEKANAHAQDVYSFYKTRSTNVELYRWLLSQMAVLYFQAYDAVAGLCLSAETSFQYEMGDFDSQIIRPNMWMDNYYGLCAGESMLFDLMSLEKEFLSRNERRLELIKTVSLRQLYEAGEFVKPKKDWDNVLKGIKETGKFDFEFTQQLFDCDYPGHYCRQIVSVSISLPVVLGPYKDVCATLTQTSSTTVLKPHIGILDYFYGDKDQMLPPYVLLNLRSHQQIGVSRGIEDAGLHQMMFGDERYLPFEGTGAISRWQLHFTRHDTRQKALIDSLTDIIVEVRYLAKAGGNDYTNAVMDLLPG